ncbi:ANTAR domain-containing protein [Cellulomonas sp. Marseille-Q8402]
MTEQDGPGGPRGVAGGGGGGGTVEAGSAADWRAGALSELTEMLASTVQVDELLDVIVGRAAARGGDGCAGAITLRLGAQATVAASTDERAAACDRAEQAAGAGPCVEASDQQVLITVPDVREERRWPAWHDATLAAGFGSAAALPAPAPDGQDLRLAINLYRTDPGPWDSAVLADVARFAEDAARAVAVAARVQEQRRVNEDLKQAMTARAVIDQALGVIMAQNRCGPEEAFGILRRASQTRNQKMREIAAEIVARVSGTAPHSPHGFRERPRR